MRDVAVRSGHGRKSTPSRKKEKKREEKKRKAGIDIARKWYEVLTYLLMTSADQHKKKNNKKNYPIWICQAYSILFIECYRRFLELPVKIRTKVNPQSIFTNTK